MKGMLSQADLEAVNRILVEELGVKGAQLEGNAKLVDDLGADSLTLVEINMALEDQLEVSIPDERAEAIQTVDDLLELLGELKTSAKG